jgi:hypothetical protein
MTPFYFYGLMVLATVCGTIVAIFAIGMLSGRHL